MLETATIIQGLLSLLFSVLATLAIFAFKTLQRESARDTIRMNEKIEALTMVVNGLSTNVTSLGTIVATLGATSKAHDESDQAQFHRLESGHQEHDQRLRVLEAGQR